jgi:hypothetical protein
MDPARGSVSWAIGSRMRVKTTLGEELEGTVFNFDATTGTLVIYQTAPSPKKSYRIIRTAFIKEAEQLAKPPAKSNGELDSSSLHLPDPRRQRTRLESSLRTARSEAAKIGVGVTKEAQSIFNALAKTLPCRWESTSIIVFEDAYMVRVIAPYKPDNCTGLDQASLNRVKTVLTGERRKLAKSSS